MRNILILGTGNFSELLQRILRSDFDIRVLSSRNASDADLAQGVLWAEVIILAVPLKGYESTIARIKPDLSPSTLLVDVCSVKEKPQQLLHKLLPEHKNWLITHPLFGPQSAAKSTKDLQFIVCEEVGEQAKQFVDFCKSKLHLKIVRMTAEEHDLQMSKAQALTFFISETLRDMNIDEQELMTPSYKKLLEVRQLVECESQDLLDLLQLDNSQATEVRRLFMKHASAIDLNYSDRVNL